MGTATNGSSEVIVIINYVGSERSFFINVLDLHSLLPELAQTVDISINSETATFTKTVDQPPIFEPPGFEVVETSIGATLSFPPYAFNTSISLVNGATDEVFYTENYNGQSFQE